MLEKPAQNDQQNQAESRSGPKEKGSVRTTTALTTPTKGPKNQHMADAPRSHGEPRHALPLGFQEPVQAQGGRL